MKLVNLNSSIREINQNFDVRQINIFVFKLEIDNYNELKIINNLCF